MEVRYKKGELLRSERFRHRRDLAEALLSDDREYTIKEAEKIIAGFLKGGK